MFNRLLISFCIAISSNAIAEIYEWKDAKGKTHFSDTIPTAGKTANGIRRRDESNLPGITTMEAQEYREPIYMEQANRRANTNNNWSECAATKRRAVIAEQRKARVAEELNTWLWQNCREYSNELRTIEQSMM